MQLKDVPLRTRRALLLYKVNAIAPFWLSADDTCMHDTCACVLPYFDKRKQVTYHLNLSYWCFHILPSELYFFQAKFYALKTLILLRNMLGKTSWSWSDWHILLFYKKFPFCDVYVSHLLRRRNNKTTHFITRMARTHDLAPK